MRKDLSLEELASIAKEAQAKYDKAVHEAKKAKGVATDGTIIATSDKVGFQWDCNADQHLVIKHTVATVNSAMETLSTNPIFQLQLVMALMEELRTLALAENDS